MNITHPFVDADGDKLREECGIFGVIGAHVAEGVGRYLGFFQPQVEELT